MGKGGLRNLGFDIPVGRVTARQAVMLNKTAEELPSESDITKADDIELQEIAEKASESMEDLISHLNDQQSQTDDFIGISFVRTPRVRWTTQKHSRFAKS